jgi:sugar transferase (PEP-CTERM/EpsH1 system associated)
VDNHQPVELGAASSLPLICHVIYRLAVGGLENGVVNLINHLPGDRYRHAIICVTSATDFRDRIRHSGVEIYELHKQPGKDIAAYGRMWRLLRTLKPHIVHTRNLPALDMMVPARLAGVPRFVHSEHGLDMIEIDGKNAKYNGLRRASRLIIHHYITMSRDLNDWMRREIGIPAERVVTIYNGVDTARFSPQGDSYALPEGIFAPDTIVIGTIGRLDPVKNHVLLARAAARLLGLRPNLRARVRLAIIGDGPERERIETVLRETGIRDAAWLPGFRDDTPALYRKFDVFVLPSRREGISNTLLEAMASGRPVVATRIGGNPEIVPDGIVGRLVEPEDVDALAQAILRYVDDLDLARAHGKAGRAHVLRSFSLDAMVKSYDEVYRSLLQDDGIPNGRADGSP